MPKYAYVKSDMSDRDRLRYWIGKVTGKPTCPFCLSEDIERKDQTIRKGEDKGKIRILFSCKDCGATNPFSRQNLIKKEVTE